MFTELLQKLKCEGKYPRAAYLAIIGGFLVQLSLGGVYTYGNMAPYMLAYMKNHTAPFQENTAGNSVWIFGLSVFGLGASMSFGGFMEPKLGTKVTILLGSWIMSFGVLITFWTIGVHLAFVAVSYGLIVGLGVGIAYGVILSIPSEWFPNSKGLVTGIVVAGFGLGPITFDFFQSFYINRDITSVHISDVSRVPHSFLLMASIYATVQFIGVMMISRPKQSKICSVENSGDVTINTVLGREMQSYIDYSSRSDSDVNLKTHQLLFERDFWILWITFTLNSVVSIMIISLHKIFGSKLNINDQYLTIISAAGAFCNGFGRILWGYFNDRIPYKVLMSILSLCMSLMLGTFYICTQIGDLNKQNDIYRLIMYFTWVIILHFLLSGNFSLFPTICVKTFGIENFAGNYGILFTGYSFAGILTSAVTTKLLDKDELYQYYLTPFLVGSALSLLSSGITLFYRGKSLMYQGHLF